MTVSGPFSGSPWEWNIPSGDGGSITSPIAGAVYTVIEEVPPGWVLRVVCEGAFNLPPNVSSFEYIPGGVRITYFAEDTVTCTFYNSPAVVGGVVMPANTLALVAPWLAVIGLVGCVVVVSSRTKRPDDVRKVAIVCITVDAISGKQGPKEKQ